MSVSISDVCVALPPSVYSRAVDGMIHCSSAYGMSVAIRAFVSQPYSHGACSVPCRATHRPPLYPCLTDHFPLYLCGFSVCLSVSVCVCNSTERSERGDRLRGFKRTRTRVDARGAGAPLIAYLPGWMDDGSIPPLSLSLSLSEGLIGRDRPRL